VKIERLSGPDYLESLRHRDMDCLLEISFGHADQEMKLSVEGQLPALVPQLEEDMKV
jgi:hypothetical protein